jgi:uncharacterized protein (TIGR02231 family)
MQRHSPRIFQLASVFTLLILTGHCSSQTVDKSTKPELQTNSGKVTKATLYRDQALVTRAISVAASKVEREVLVGQLPDEVVVESVYADGLGSIQVRGVRVGRQPIGGTNRPEVQKLTNELEAVKLEVAELQHKQQAVKKQVGYIDSLMNFSAVSTSGDLSRGVLDAKSLTELSQFTMETNKKLSDELYQYERTLAAKTAAKTGLEQQLALLTKSDNPIQQATVTVAAGPAGVIHLSYLVGGCSWQPDYTVGGSTTSDKVNLRYNALIQQMSGEDWSQVQLTLSSASPNVTAAGPSLTPFRVALAKSPNQRAPNMPAGKEPNVINDLQTLLQKQSTVASQFSSGYRQNDNLDRDLALNDVANEFQNLELQAEAAQLKSIAADIGSGVTSQTYEVAAPVSLASRREHHNVLVVEADLQGKMYHVATPLLSSFAFREVQLKNDRQVGLLGGPATVYLDGKFVGRTELPSTASGQNLVVGFGADQQVRTRRELMTKDDEIQGGNRLLTMNYRLVVANFKKTPIALRIMDRLPLVGQGTDIKVEMKPAANLNVSKDGLYQRIQKPRGILRWDVEVAPEKFGENAYDLEYALAISFDRTAYLTTNLGGANQLQQDLIESAPSVRGGMGGGGMGGMGGGMFGTGGAVGNGGR